jgi:hypothetical protein
MAVENHVPFYSVKISLCDYELLYISSSSVAHLVKECESRIGVLVTSYRLVNTNSSFD